MPTVAPVTSRDDVVLLALGIVPPLHSRIAVLLDEPNFEGALAIAGFPFRKTDNRPPEVGGAGFALAPRRLKRPIRRLRINASPYGKCGCSCSWISV